MKLSIELANGKRLSYDSCGDLLVIDAPRVEVTGKIELHTHVSDPFGSITTAPAPQGFVDTVSKAAYIQLLNHAATLRERIVNGAEPETRKAVEVSMAYIRGQEQLYLPPRP